MARADLLKHLVVFGVAGLIGCSFVVFGAHVYPLPGADSFAFVPPAVMQKRGDGLLNPLSRLSGVVDPSGADRYLEYPPLFPLLVSALMPTASADGAFLVISSFSAVTALLLAALLLRWTKSTTVGAPWARIVALTCSLAGCATWLVGAQSGRPEALAALLSLLLLHVVLGGPSLLGWLGAGAIVGLTGATQPTAGAILGLLLVVVASLWLPTWRAAVVSAASAVTAVVVFLVIIALGPFSMRDTLRGIAAHARLVGGRDPSGSLAYYWLTRPSATFVGMAFVVFLALGLARLRCEPGCVRSWPVLVAGSTGLAGFGWWAAIRVPELAYNLQFLTPAVFAGTFLAIRRQSKGRASGRVLFAVGAVHAICAVGYLRYVLLLGVHLSSGVELQVARRSFNEILAGRTGPVAVTPSLWVLTEDYRRLVVCGSDRDARDCGASILVVQQSYSGSMVPPHIPGFELVRDRFVRTPCAVGGVKLASSVPGYGFAVYHPIGGVALGPSAKGDNP